MLMSQMYEFADWPSGCAWKLKSAYATASLVDGLSPVGGAQEMQATVRCPLAVSGSLPRGKDESARVPGSFAEERVGAGLTGAQ